MNRYLRTLTLIPVLMLLGAGHCHAQVVPPVHIGGNEVFLGALHGPPRDQMIVVDLTVKQDGTVADADMVTGFFDDEYRVKAVEALKNLRFKPATQDGVPVDFYGWRFVLTTRRSFTTSIGPGFRHQIEQVSTLMQADNLVAAESAVQDLIDHKIVTVFEYAFLNEALVPIYINLNRPYDALLASRRATLRSGHMEVEYIPGTRIRSNDPHWPYFLTQDLLVRALRQRFTIAASLERFGEATATYNELRTLEDLPDNDPITVRARDLEIRRRSPVPFALHGQIEHGEWEFSPTRRLLSMKAAPGVVRSIDIKCHFHRERVPFDSDHDLLLPPPWGVCTLLFTGDEGADIQLLEKILPRTGP